jgi:hypothetical protein
MSSLKSFEEGLEKRIGRPTRLTGLRPFVCDGSPLECEVFIVGFNPATSVGFWEFWDTGHGFDKKAWFEAYKKKKQNGIGPAHRILECALESAAPVKCLETNLYSAPTKSAAGLPRQQRKPEIFDYLLATIKPKVIVAYAAEAVRHIHSISDSTGQSADWVAKQPNAPPFDALPATITVAHCDDAVTFSARVIPVKHFIYWSQENAPKLGQQVKSVCGDGNRGL